MSSPTSTAQWQVDRLDLSAYLDRIGVSAAPPSIDLLNRLHEAHVRTFTFDNIDVLLRQHAGISLDAIQEKFLGRGRGGYCFEHGSLFAAVLERLGFDVRRRLARVGDPATGSQQGRTHVVVEVAIDGRHWLCDPGFGMSLLRPIELADGAVNDHLGWQYRLDRQSDPTGWQMSRLRDGGWQVMHTADDLPVRPVDLAMGHHFTSTFPDSHFLKGLMLTRHLPGRHVSLTLETLTIRYGDAPTEHRPLRDGELADWLEVLEVPLTDEEQKRLLALTPPG